MTLVAYTLVDKLYIFLVAIYDECINSPSKQLNTTTGTTNTPHHTLQKFADFNYYHTENTKFMHSAIQLKYIDDNKQYGLIANKKIPFGTVLSVELPIITIPQESYDLNDEMANIEKMIYVIHEEVEKNRKKDAEFQHIWENEFIENQKDSQRL